MASQPPNTQPYYRPSPQQGMPPPQQFSNPASAPMNRPPQSQAYPLQNPNRPPFMPQQPGAQPAFHQPQYPNARPDYQQPMPLQNPLPMQSPTGPPLQAQPLQPNQMPQNVMAPIHQPGPPSHQLTSPPASRSHRRAYPEQINSAYAPATSAPLPPQSQQAYASPASGTTAPMGDNIQPGQGIQNQYASSPYSQPGMAAITNQMANMGIQSTPAMGTANLLSGPPNILDMDKPIPKPFLPPQTQCTSSESSNCDRIYQMCTLGALPQTTALLNKSRLPLGLIICPYRTLEESKNPIPVVHDQHIVRCRRCRTYVNPFIQFVDQGTRWKCNMCFHTNDVPASFDYHPDTRARIDRFSRPEINHGVVEYVAPEEYMIRPPQPLVYLFIVDVSYSAVSSGMVSAFSRSLLAALDRIPNEEKRTQVAFIAVDSSLHYFKFHPTAPEPTMFVVADLEEAFLPQPQDLLVNLAECRGVIDTFLKKLPSMFSQTQNVGNCLGSALLSGFKLISSIGGKIVVLQSTLPNKEKGGLKNREDAKLFGTPKESTLLIPSDSFYKKFAIDCSRSQVCVDTFIFGTAYVDIATLSSCSKYTGGLTYYYANFNGNRKEDATKFGCEFVDFLSKPIGLEAVMRVRCSAGLQLSAFHGTFFVRSMDLLVLPNVAPDVAYGIELTMESNLQGNVAFFQTAILHTTSFGERRIRVLTNAVPVVTDLKDVFHAADPYAIINLLAKKAVDKAISFKLEDARDALVNKCVDVLGVYRAGVLGVGNGPVSQMPICENMKLFPLLTLGLLKNITLRFSNQIPSDLRSFNMSYLKVLPLDFSNAYLLPRFYSLHDMSNGVGYPGDDGNIIMPPIINLTSERMERNGIYFLDNSQVVFLYIGKAALPEHIYAIFGVDSFDSIIEGKVTLPPPSEQPFSIQTNNVLSKIRQQRRMLCYPTLYVVKEDGEPALRIWFFSHLIVDRQDNGMSYYQFLQALKDKVANEKF